MLDYFHKYISDHQLIGKKESLLVAVSGGVDSMVLAHLLLKLRFDFSVVHINYQLRGKDSALDTELVKTWCNENSVRFFYREAPKSIYEGSDSVQMAARAFRYAFFEELKRKFGFNKVVLAHHLDDSLETFLFNLTKGTGLHGLTGISEQNGSVVRPLMFATKEQIISYAKQESIKWREDKSNEKNDYQRNKIRNKVIPVLKDINPALQKTFSRNMERLKHVQCLVDTECEKIKESFLKEDKQHLYLSMRWFDEKKGGVALLIEILADFGFSYFQVNDIVEAYRNRSVGAQFTTETCILHLDRDQLVMTSNQREIEINQQLSVPGNTETEMGLLKTEIISGNELPKSPDSNTAYLDFDVLGDSLLVRNWEQGDFFIPLGMKGKKKVSDYMIDTKIPVSLKKDVLVLESPGGLCWIVGMRIDERFKVQESTKRVLRINFHPYV